MRHRATGCMTATRRALPRLRPGGTKATDALRRSARISKPFAARRLRPTPGFLTSTSDLGVSGMGVATTRPFHLYAYDHGAERRRKPRNPAHSVSVSGVGEVGVGGDTNPKDTRPPGGLARCRVTIVRRATTDLPPLCEEGPGVKGFVVAPGAEARAADAHVDLSDRRVPVRTRRGPEGSISGLLQPLTPRHRGNGQTSP
jgi:hypothetical protein